MDNATYLKRAQEQIRNEWKAADGRGKMIYADHNLAKNFNYASASNDTIMQSDIIISEIANLIRNNLPLVQSLLQQYFPDGLPGNTIQQVSVGLMRSKAFATAITTAIFANQTKSADGSDDTTDTLQTVGTDLSDATSFLGGIKSLFGGSTATSNPAASANTNAAAQAALAKALAAQSSSSSNLGLYIGIGVLLVVGIGFAFYMMRKKS